MIAGAVKSEQPPLEAGSGQRLVVLPHEEAARHPDAAPDRTGLQAIHASLTGVLLKGKSHETFWAW